MYGPPPLLQRDSEREIEAGDDNATVFCGGPGCSDSFLRFLSGSPCFLFGRRVVLAGG